MKALTACTKAELAACKQEYEAEYQDFKAQNLKLDMSRGKPAPEQLDLSMPMMDVLTSKDLLQTENGFDCRNYGMIDGIPEAKRVFADILGVSDKEIIICGNSSLNVMFDTVAAAYTHGILGNTPWCQQKDVKFLCPVPGYDRHFSICEWFGIEMINVPLKEDGPDMDLVEKLVSADSSIKGIWCVPQYANPTGCCYSDQVVRRFANLKPKAPDFRIFWDNAYCIHHLVENPPQVLNLMDACKEAGNPNLPYIFASTSKVSFPGSGISMIAGSEENMTDLKKTMSIRTIGYDKINQLRHVRFFHDAAGLRAHMEKHRLIIRPKFEAVINKLNADIRPLGIADWTEPKGGYFISFNSMPGCAKRIVQLCKEAGVTLTGAGATYPYGKDPEDRNIRIAPTYPSVAELTKAMELFCICVKLASVEKLLAE